MCRFQQGRVVSQTREFPLDQPQDEDRVEPSRPGSLRAYHLHHPRGLMLRRRNRRLRDKPQDLVGVRRTHVRPDNQERVAEGSVGARIGLQVTAARPCPFGGSQHHPLRESFRRSQVQLTRLAWHQRPERLQSLHHASTRQDAQSPGPPAHSSAVTSLKVADFLRGRLRVRTRQEGQQRLGIVRSHTPDGLHEGVAQPRLAQPVPLVDLVRYAA